ncbi:MAG: nucleotidyltransferase domain-containing protein [Rhodospirillaceae bacterium]|nr:nucleotidyltransferase domain-containing protein [Rhodospirillaceae bacterium]
MTMDTIDRSHAIVPANTTPVRARALNTVHRIVAEGLAGHPARVFLFGSSARSDVLPRSDIDVAILPLAPLPFSVFAKIASELDESPIPYTVDLVNLDHASPDLRETILVEGLEWPMP